MDIRRVATLLKGEVTGPDSVLFPTPGHGSSDRGSSLKFDLQAPDGFLIHVFNGEDPIAVKKHVIEALQMPCAPLSVSASSQSGSHRNQDIARRIWRESKTPTGSLVEKYLASRRLFLPDQTLELDVVRFHPNCSFGKEQHPAMICLMRKIGSNEPTAIHRTALLPDGSGKATMSDGCSPKRVLGPAAGSVVKLMRHIEGVDLSITEGIENGLTVLNCRAMPTWAVGSVTGMRAFPTIDGIPSLSIFADNDNAGLIGARAAAIKWKQAGRSALILTPNGFSDWNEWRAANA